MIEVSLVPLRAVLVSKGWCSTFSVHLLLEWAAGQHGAARSAH